MTWIGRLIRKLTGAQLTIVLLALCVVAIAFIVALIGAVP